MLNNPDELKLHKLAMVEKLRERIGDDDESVRETLYQLFKSVIFPGGAKVIARCVGVNSVILEFYLRNICVGVKSSAIPCSQIVDSNF